MAGTYEDLDISGRKGLDQRHQLRAALEAIEAGEAQHLVAAKIDRVARSVITFNEVVQRLQRAGAALVSVAEGLDFSSPAGRMVANVLATFAQFESEQIGARVKSAQTHLVAEGKWRGGRRPFGWKPVEHESGKGYRLAIDPEEAAVVREVVERVMAGEHLHAIAGDLNRRGVRSAHGHPWVRGTLRQVLTRPTMIGRHGAERMVSDREYAALQVKLQRKERAPRNLERPRGLVPGSVLTCGACGRPMRETFQAGRPVYRCTARNIPGDGGCSLQASTRAVDRLVEERLLSVMGSRPVAVVAEPVTVDPAAEERASILERMGALEEDRYIRGLFPGETGAERFQAIYSSLQKLLDELPAPYTIEPDEDDPVPTGEHFAAAWEAANIETRRGWVEAVLLSVEVAPGRSGRPFDPDRLTYHWRG